MGTEYLVVRNVAECEMIMCRNFHLKIPKNGNLVRGVHVCNHTDGLAMRILVMH